MSLIKSEQLPTVKDHIVDVNTSCLINMKNSAKINFELFWFNPEKTPQEICDMFGTDAVKAFQAHSKLQELIYFLDPSWEPLVPPYTYVSNQNGTITINVDPPEVNDEPETLNQNTPPNNGGGTSLNMSAISVNALNIRKSSANNAKPAVSGDTVDKKLSEISMHINILSAVCCILAGVIVYLIVK
jgi:hypothetical protein